MHHRSPTRRRWVVLPTAVAAAAALVATVAWASGSDGPAPSNAAAPASFDGGQPAGDRPAADRAGADRTPAAAQPADRSRRVIVVPPAGRLRPTASPSRTRNAAPPRPTTAPAPSSHTPAPPAPRPTTPTTPSTAAPAPSGGVTAQVVTLTNAERAKAGCGPLAVDATLTAVAQAHSQDMATNNYFDHNSQDGRTPFDRMTAAGYRYSTAAENIAAGQRTPQDVMTAWMNSPGHRANILNCALKEIGVGYATASSSQYGAYWTQDFGTPR
jgi:uncharacterized protein YkwD